MIIQFIILCTLVSVAIHTATWHWYLFNKQRLRLKAVVPEFFHNPLRACLTCMWWCWTIITYSLCTLIGIIDFTPLYLIIIVPSVIGLNTIIANNIEYTPDEEYS